MSTSNRDHMDSNIGIDQNVADTNQKLVDMIQDWNRRVQRLGTFTQYDQGYMDGIADVFNDLLNVLGVDAHEHENKSGAV